MRPSASRAAAPPRGPRSCVVDAPVQAKPGASDGVGVGTGVGAGGPTATAAAAVHGGGTTAEPPAGCQTGRAPPAAFTTWLARRSAGSVPPASIVHQPAASPSAPGATRTNRILPSGVQPARLEVPSEVSWRMSLPSGRIVYRSSPPPCGDSNRMRAPSGDQSASCAGSVAGLICPRFFPSASTTQTAGSLGGTGPPLSFSPKRKKTICFPSRDQLGWAVASDAVERSSETRPDARSIVAISVDPSADPRTKAMLLPSLENETCESLKQGSLQPVSTAIGALPPASVTYNLPSSEKTSLVPSEDQATAS